MKKAAILILLTGLLIFSIYELNNISKLYNDQEGMAEFLLNNSLQKTSPTDTTQLNDFKFEINSWRTLYIGYMAFYVFYVGRMFWLARKPS